MGTYTPNLNLYKPDASDPFGEFREKFNDNMDILDNGGGGGSGGHTIYDENGSAMTQRTGLEFTGNVQVTDDSVNDKTIVDILGGGGNVYGAFVDPSHIVKSQTLFVGSTSYTATEDCFVALSLTTRYNASALIKIDGVTVQSAYLSNGTNALGLLVGVKKGQTLSVSDADNNNNSAYTVYGVTQGTNGIFAPVIYSDTERKIGIWRDNKPLYQRTFDLGSDINISDTAWVSTGITLANVENIINGYGVSNDGSFQGSLMLWNDSSNIKAQTARNNSSAWVRYITMWYTKTTDVAGSGNWNTDGVPTVHYSTSEQVIGTWIDGKPIYKKTWDFSGSPVMLSYQNWVNSGISAGENIKSIISAELKYGVVTNMAVEVAVGADGYPVAFQKVENTGNTRGVTYCTLIYTKTTD